MHPILLEWGPFTFYSYGLMIGLGFLLALSFSGRRAKRAGLDPAAVQGVVVLALLLGLLGARAAYVALNWELYRDNPLEVIRFDHGGLVFYGGLAAGVAGALWALRRYRLPMGRTLDLLTPPLVLAHAIGRVGCFLNGCCYGKPTTLPWGVIFRGEDLPRHPTQLYESAALLLLLGILLRMEARSSLRSGAVFISYLLLYGLWRFCVEFLRGDNPFVALGLTPFQWISLPFIGISFLLILRRSG